MMIIGLTGGIGMGKTTVAKILKLYGIAAHDADRAVHRLLGVEGEAVKPVAELLPGSLKKNGAIDRKKVGQAVFGQPVLLEKLERILHPLVQRQERAFIAAAKKRGDAAVVLDIPLLFETGGDRRCDVTICVTATKAVQKTRALQRPGMTAEKLRAILSRQMKDSERKRRADAVVRSDQGLEEMERQLRKALRGFGILDSEKRGL